MSDDKLEKPHDESITFSRQVDLSEAENHDLFVESFTGKTRRITVEPLAFMFIIVMYFQLSVMNQYINYRVGIDYNITSKDDKIAFVCNASDSSEKIKTDKIQKLNAKYSMLIQLSNCVFTILTAPFYCSFSDRYGRKIMFLIPGIGVFVKTLVEVFIIKYDLPITLFIVTEGFYGLCGGFNFASNLAYCYVADISTQKARTKRMAIMGILLGIGSLCDSLSTGFWIKDYGYLPPYIFTSCVTVLCVLYTIFLLQEPPRMIDPKVDMPSKIEQFKHLFTIYISPSRSRSAILILFAIMFNFYYISTMSSSSLSTTYLMSFPICMTSVEIGYYGVLNMVAINVGVGIIILLLTRWFSELFLVFICILSGILFSLQMAFSVTKVAIYIATVSNLFSYSGFPFIRGYLSKVMSPKDQGALFGGLVLFETISSSITKVVVIYFYGATFLIFRGMAYLLLTCFGVIAAIMTLITVFINYKFKPFEICEQKSTDINSNNVIICDNV